MESRSDEQHGPPFQWRPFCLPFTILIRSQAWIASKHPTAPTGTVGRWSCFLSNCAFPVPGSTRPVYRHKAARVSFEFVTLEPSQFRARQKSLGSSKFALPVFDPLNIAGQIPANRKPRKPLPTIIKTLGDRIQVRRFEKGLLQSEVAEKLRVPISLVRAWENDVLEPNHDEWNRLAKVLGTSNLALELHNPI
jgi:DNA-binding transcriptional regulator YiaG